MKIEFVLDTQFSDNEELCGGGYALVTAESLADTKRIVDYFKIHNGDDPESLIKRAQSLSDPALVHVHRPKKRPYYKVNGSLDVQLFQAYRDWAKRCFGFNGRWPDLQLTFPHGGLRHIYLGVWLRTEVGETVCYSVLTQSEPWNNQTAQDYATKRVSRYIAEDFGHSEPVREFIDNGNGTYRRNPKYATGFRNPVTPRLVNDSLCNAFVSWWLEHEANDNQKEIIAKNRQLVELSGNHCAVDWIKDYSGFYILDPSGSCNWDGKGTMVSHVTMEEFASA